ncbi:TetR/AcrR family transcriptional regulator [Glaciimonas sp. PCH181]|uniref:TetR/AcrR family transcriptional regulator n=1 Tax=Glaciimonas sp. PCH181 TaxID=2133943 RepID=UPI000D3B6FA1|nr:TetR/AcrR family transcriptional regulator [Glaciimonas sp. PCH181]PUA19990.1 TetR family transcriptional regulator [Glaciimonas sp. PCH181]
MRTTYDTTRRHILDAGQQLIVVKGFAGVGLNEILTAAAIPKGSFYHYFGSKEQYGCALMEQYFSDYLLRLDQLLHPSPEAADASSARARLITYWERWVDTQCSQDVKEKCLVVKLSAEVADLSEDMRMILCEGTKRVRASLTACIANGVTDGSLQSSIDPEKTAQMLYQMWLGASLLAKLQRDRTPLEYAFATTIATLREPVS